MKQRTKTEIAKSFGKYRTFDGKRFTFKTFTFGQRAAESEKKKMKAKGYNCRIIETDGVFAVYVNAK